LIVSINKNISLQACLDGKLLIIFWWRILSFRKISVYINQKHSFHYKILFSFYFNCCPFPMKTF
jgi:hypothetical protein